MVNFTKNTFTLSNNENNLNSTDQENDSKNTTDDSSSPINYESGQIVWAKKILGIK